MAEPNIMALSEDVMVLTKEGLTTLAKELLESVNERIEERIVNVMNEGSDGQHVPSAELVWNSLQGISKLRNVMVKSGDITEAHLILDEQTIYVLRKSLTDVSGTPYVWRKDVGFICLGGSTTIGSTDGINIVAMSKTDIVAAVKAAENQTKPSFGGSAVNPTEPTPTDPGESGGSTGEGKDPDSTGENPGNAGGENPGTTGDTGGSGTTPPATGGETEDPDKKDPTEPTTPTEPTDPPSDGDSDATTEPTTGGEGTGGDPPTDATEEPTNPEGEKTEPTLPDPETPGGTTEETPVTGAEETPATPEIPAEESTEPTE